MKKIAESIDKHTGNSLELRVLHELGQTTDGYLNPKKVGELWDEFQKHDVLFTEHTAGKFEPFFYIQFAFCSTCHCRYVTYFTINVLL